MVNQPQKDMQGAQAPASKLVLPAPPDEGLYRQNYSSPRPEQSIHHSTSPASHGLFTRLYRLWRKDPAYAVLSLAIALVVIASLIFVALGAHALMGGNNGQAWNSSMTQHPAAPTPVGTVDNKPSFATPGSNKGSSVSSQPAGGGSTNSPQPAATTPADQGTLSVQIISIPNVVRNNSRVSVVVQASEPDVSVRLQVTYDTAPFYYTSSSHTTNGNGDASIPWNVRVLSVGGSGAQATVVVIATDRNGQQANSQSVTVIIN